MTLAVRQNQLLKQPGFKTLALMHACVHVVIYCHTVAAYCLLHSADMTRHIPVSYNYIISYIIYLYSYIVFHVVPTCYIIHTIDLIYIRYVTYILSY